VATTYLTPGVYVEEVPSSSATLTAGATAVAAFVGFTASYPRDDEDDPFGEKPRLVTSWAQYERLYGGFVKGAMLPHSVYGYFNNGGSLAYIVRIPNSTPATESGTLALPAGDKNLGTAVEFTTVEANADIVVSIAPEPPPVAKEGDKTAPSTAPTFRLDVTENGEEKPVETFSGLTLTKGDRNVETIVNKESTKIKVETKLDISSIDETLALLPAGNHPIKPADPKALEDIPGKAFAGSENERKGINGLVIADEVTMVLVPDLVTAAKLPDGKPDLAKWKAVQLALINHCEGQRNRVAILDAPPKMTPQRVKEWRVDEAGYSSQFATLYYPWIKVTNPAGTNGDSEIMVPPSGHMAGIWARTDDTRGVWKAPANEVVRGALDVEMNITKAEQGLLNPIGVNCIRPFGTRGIRIWGARTLSSETEWQYINVRRLFNMIETAIMDGTQYAVFEPNDITLWEGLKRTINAFLRGLWRDGALFGATAEQAFYVKCDSETNPPESIDQGKVVVEVGIAPVKPAEFVIFRIAQIKEESA
jgi:phage tail sheath protein FI